MVMENNLAPQWVGREFVRQYYTLLNRSPDHLHRFYNNNSAFIHGSMDPTDREGKVAIGQKQIHQRIQQLNFSDCHAKIIQVDCQSTLDDGVVIQVTGQLSNFGQPMRHFTQTFVLAAQSPRKYYVRNDIFRYQDIASNDDKSEEHDRDSVRSEGDESELENSPPADSVAANSQPVTPQQQVAYYAASPSPVLVSPQQGPALPSNVPVLPVTHQPSTIQHLPQVNVHQPNIGTSPQPSVNIGHQPTLPTSHPVQIPYSAVSPEINNPVSPEDLITSVSAAKPLIATDDLQSASQVEATSVEVEEVNEVEAVDTQEAIEETTPTEPEQEESRAEEAEEEEDKSYGDTSDEQQNQSDSNEPKTYATLVKSGGMGGVGTPSFVPASAIVSVSHKSPASPPPTVTRISESRDTTVQAGNNISTVQQNIRGPSRGARGGSTVRGMRNDRPSSGRGNYNDDTGSLSGDNDRRRSVGMQHTDNQQLFLGNLPHHATEEDLRQLFSNYGKVLDLRIHSKQNSKGPSGNRVPNYGFITFEDSATVQHVLRSRPFYFPGEGGQKLNVEEKKICQRQSGDAARTGTNELFINRMNNNGGPRPMAGGMMRGGGPGPGRGGRGGFSRADDRGGSMNRGVPYVRR